MGNKFCGLGVSCDISGVGKWDGGVYKAEVSQSASIMPMEVQGWLGVKVPNPHLGGNRTGASMNDAGKSFSEIADAIEKRYKLKSR